MRIASRFYVLFFLLVCFTATIFPMRKTTTVIEEPIGTQRPSLVYRVLTNAVGRFVAISSAVGFGAYHFTVCAQKLAKLMPSSLVPEIFEHGCWPGTDSLLFGNPQKAFVCALVGMGCAALFERLYRGGIPGFNEGTHGQMCSNPTPNVDELQAKCTPYYESECAFEILTDLPGQDLTFKNLFNHAKQYVGGFHLSDAKRIAVLSVCLLIIRYCVLHSVFGVTDYEKVELLIKTVVTAFICNSVFKKCWYPWRHQAATIVVQHGDGT